MVKKTILITGANRGIGFEIARQLGSMGHRIILTARDKIKGERAKSDLRNMDHNIDFYQLDLEESVSIREFGKRLKVDFVALDVLINNAGVYLDGSSLAHNVNFEVVQRTLQINLLGGWELINEMIPLLKKSSDPRIINMSSGMGAFSDLSSGYSAYRISKTGLNSLTKILSSELPKMKINAVCPGWVQTDMGGPGASRSVEHGAETAVWLATAEDIPTGKFLRDKNEISW